MTIQGRPKIVVLGMMGRMRVGGGVWQTLHYVLGLQRLGYDVYYIEAHGSASWAFQDKESEAAAFVGSILRGFDMSDKWAFHARTGSGSYYGLSEYQVSRLYESAAAVLNLHGGTVPTPEQIASGRLVYIDTDPVAVQVEIHQGVHRTIEILSQHCALFTFGENYGNPDCGLPVCPRFEFKPTRQPVLLDFWTARDVPTMDVFTTVGNWKQLRRIVEYNGEDYYWSKHFEFLKVIDLPRRTPQPLELSLSGCDEASLELLASHNWNVRDAFTFSQDIDAYRQYIMQSKAEFTVAKDQNIRLRTGWFSDRSATYLSSGRPVVTQETAFSNILPTGQGLFAFSTVDEAVDAIESINSNYRQHRQAAQEIAHEYFAHDVVLNRLLSELGISRKVPHALNETGDRVSVNIIGDFSALTGMQATANGYKRAFESAGVNVETVDVLHDGAVPNRVPAGTVINLMCCEIASHFSVRTALGADVFQDHYNIGVWLWELPSFPNEWYDRFAYYDEIWAPSSFIASALSPISPVPVVHIPFVLQPRVLGSREAGRRRLEISADEFVYLFVFNFYSRHQRKNPTGVIDAFNTSFGSHDPVRLVIKCTNGDFDCEHFEELKSKTEGRRISIYEGRWSEREMADVMAACDCYVSLHRSEGVGVTISDAMAAGKPVVATGWSGNLDFMNVSNSFPVQYRLVRLNESVAHYRAGDVWAEPSIDHAAEMMRYVFEHRDEARSRARSARKDIRSNYSADAIAPLIARRLAVISKRRQFRMLKDRIEKPIADMDRFIDEFSALDQYVPANALRYEQLKEKIRRIVRSKVPPGATLVVVSKGDDDLLNLNGCRAWHFPLAPDYRYAGFYPKDSVDAIQHIEAVRAMGGDFLLFPNTALWWLDHYSEFREHLVTRYKVAHRDESCVIFELR